MQDLKKVILGTGNYNNVKEGNRVSVTGDGGNAWGYFDASYKKLSPKLITYIPYKENLERLKEIKDIDRYKKIKTIIEDEYIKSYYDIRLKNLNVIELLYKLKNYMERILFYYVMKI